MPYGIFQKYIGLDILHFLLFYLGLYYCYTQVFLQIDLTVKYK